MNLIEGERRIVMKKLAAIIAGIAIIGMAGVAAADTTTGSLGVSATVVGKFVITSTSPISFTLDPTITSDATATGSATYWGTKSASGVLTMDNGLNPVGGERYLKSAGTPSETIKYSLSPITDNYTGQGKNTPKILTITGTIANADFVDKAALSDYADTVTLTITY
jgi:spore coat protein U-like protein